MNNFNSSNSRKILGSKCKTVKWQSGRSQIKIIFCFTIVAMLWFSSSVYGEPLKLAENGKTVYTIIAGGHNNAVDKMAVAELVGADQLDGALGLRDGVHSIVSSRSGVSSRPSFSK